MSNYLAVATITATLQRTLQGIVQADLEGARITTVRPSDIGNGTPETGVNLFLYQVITNPALNNIDSAPARSRGNPTKRQAALDLYYMLSFYGNEAELEPQRLLGSVVRSLNDKRVINQDMIRAACRDATLPFLQESNLADQVQQIGVVPLDLNLEDLSKAWSVFFQTPYLLSIGYKVMVVMVDGDTVPARGLPIRDRRTNELSPYFSQPQIEQVMAQGGLSEPILTESTLVISGRQLKGDWATQVRVCGVEVVPAEVSATQILLPLSQIPAAALRSGVQSLQVIHPPQGNDHVDRRRGKESNAAAFVLRPRLSSVVLLDSLGEDDEPRSGQLQLQINLPIGIRQRAVMVLNEWGVDRPTSYLFDAPSRNQESNSIAIPFQEVKPGEYLVRLMVDGAESQLQVDDNPDSPTYEWFIAPKVLIR
ncbi:MAG TPA: Pvc16 family protein [Thermosynechococcaceae cyanobacterium]